jgi:uncharacterized protein YutE (UPF0331/DUF86 family)
MVDSVRLTRLLARMTDTVAELRATSDDEHSRQWLLAVKYLFVVAIEASTDVAQHLCASEGWGPPSTNADAMRVLARHGVIDEVLGDQLARAVGFRNVLVHQYAEVDDDRVVAMLDRLGDLDAFAAAVATHLSS